ncbi:TPA: hypothetical protein HA225_05620 [Candidatus Micrarchaeota archaeon]|nr:hypothetical protein [Candidatus Micrarchaeota archaeon]HIH30210.1 hypothetical protein [Candidatus Micrarchaeota archaeon]
MKGKALLALFVLLPLVSSAQAGNLAKEAEPIAKELQMAMAIGVLLCYIFAAGRIADFLQSSGRSVSKKEIIYAPIAYVLFSMIGVIFYFGSGSFAPPQNTLITNAVYLLLIPLGIAIGVGTVVLHSFFRDRLNAVQSLDLSMKIILAPIFDGMRGYWVAIGAAALVVFISGASYFSSGGNFSLVTFDFLLASILVAIYFLYKAFTSRTNEGRASNIVTMLTVLSPSLLRLYFREMVCAWLTKIPIDFFRSCPLDQVGSEVTLALSVAATLLVLVPVIPLIYAVMVNALRVLSVLQVLTRKERAFKPVDKTD